VSAPRWVIKVGGAREQRPWVWDVTLLSVLTSPHQQDAIRFECLACAGRLARRIRRRRFECGEDEDARVVRLVKRKRGGN
jgi:hypothetical protein